MAENTVIGQIQVDITCRGQTMRVAISASTSQSYGDWSILRASGQSLVPKIGDMWAGTWVQRGADAELKSQNGKDTVITLCGFHFPPDSGDQAAAYVRTDGLIVRAPASVTASSTTVAPPTGTPATWEPVLTDQLLQLKIKECEQIQHEIEQIAIDMGITIAGVYDPTPVSGLLLAGRALARNDLLEAVLCCAFVIPYLGDLAAFGPFVGLRTTKLARLMERLEKLAKWLGKEKAAAKATTMKGGEAFTPVSKAAPTGLAKYLSARSTKLLSRRMPGWKSGMKPSQIAREAEETIPIMRNPRALAKHVDADHTKLVRELEQKGFVQVQAGRHGRRGGAEMSDIWVRRVMVGEKKQVWEAVRVDIKTMNKTQMKMADARNLNIDKARKAGTYKPGMGNPPYSRIGSKQADGSPWPKLPAGTWQSQGKGARQVHMRLGHETNPERLAEVAADMNAGKILKGDVTHWHHEVFDDLPGMLEKYLTNSPMPKSKLDFSGRAVNVQ